MEVNEQMNARFDSSIPIYTQIIEVFRRDMASGALKPGQRVTPVRELALLLGVNPNTLQRALSELEREGLMYSERTSGRFVTEDGEKIAALRRNMSRRLASDCVDALRGLGLAPDDIRNTVEEKLREEKEL